MASTENNAGILDLGGTNRYESNTGPGGKPLEPKIVRSTPDKDNKPKRK